MKSDSDKETTTTIENELLAMAAMVSTDLVAMAEEQIENLNGKLFVRPDRDGLNFITPADWWGMVGAGIGLTPANQVQFGPATWQASLFGKAMDLLGFTEVLTSKQVSAHRKGEEQGNITTVFTVKWDDHEKILGHSRASIATKNADFRESRKQTNRLMYKEGNFAQKEQRFRKYQAEAIIMLLQGKKTAYPEEFGAVFVQKSDYMLKNPKAANTKAQYEVHMTGAFEGEEFTQHENAWAKVDVVDEKGKKLTKENAIKKLVGLGVPEEKLGDWEKINAAAIEKGCARVYYPEVADLLGGGPMGILASLSQVNEPPQSRMVNWKILLGHKSNIYFGKDTAGLDAEVLQTLRKNCLALGVLTPERDTRLNLFEVGENGLPACDYKGNEAVWREAVGLIGWREHGVHSDNVLSPDHKKWIETVPFPALEYGRTGVMATWEPVQVGDYFYPIFGLEETARPNAE